MIFGVNNGDYMKYKILIVAGTMNVGGLENQLMHLLRMADKEKYQIDFTTTVSEPFYRDEIESLGSKCISLPPTGGKHFFRYCKALYKVIKEGDYDVVHSHELFHSGLVLLTARLAGVKARFVHAHNWRDGDGTSKPSTVRKIYNSVMRFLIVNNATDFVACSTLAGRFLYGEKVTEQKNYHLVFNSVDTSKFILNFDKEETGEFCGDGFKNVLQVGRFTPVKNQLFTVKIAKELKNRGEKIRILCAGNCGGEYDEKVIASIKENGVEDYMVLLGVRKDIDVLTRKSEAFLLPSYYEGMPLVVIEAQAAGLRCVLADTFSHEVDFGIGTVEWLQLNDSVSAWTDAIISAVNSQKPEKRIVVDAVEKGGYDSAVFARKLCELYEKSIKEKI